MCNRTIPYTCGSNDTGRKKNLELEFEAELSVSCVPCQAIDFSLRKTFLAVPVRHSFLALTLKHSEDLDKDGGNCIGLQGKELQCCVLWERGQSTPGGYST